jgi:hypothetical protein
VADNAEVRRYRGSGPVTAVEIQAPTTVPCAAGTLNFAEDGRVTAEGPGASTTITIPELRKRG